MSEDGGSSATEGAVTVHRTGEVLRLVLDRAARRNSLSHAMIDTLISALTDAASDDSLRAVHIRGASDDFCAGADWVAANTGGQARPRTGDLVRRIPHAAHRVIELVATIQLPFLTRGFSPDSGSTWLLPRLVGPARAKQMLLLGEKVSGADAAAWGLIHRCVAAADVDNATEDLLVRLAAGPTVAIGLTKQAIHYGQHATLSQAMNQELFNLELSCRTADFKEGLAAFRDRRTPEFQGR